jgi:hypothetical protein
MHQHSDHRNIKASFSMDSLGPPRFSERSDCGYVFNVPARKLVSSVHDLLENAVQGVVQGTAMGGLAAAVISATSLASHEG